MIKKRLAGIVILLVALTGVLSFVIANGGLKLVGESVTNDVETNSDVIVLNGEDASATPAESPVVSETNELPSPEETTVTDEASEFNGADSGFGTEAQKTVTEDPTPIAAPQASGGGMAAESIGPEQIVPGVPPVSSVDYFTNIDETSNKVECKLEKDGIKRAYLSYDSVVGHGTTNDVTFSIIEVHTRLDNLAQFLAACDDASCNDGDKTEKWHTQTNKNLAEGWHTLWGRAKNAKSNLEDFSDSNKCEFCIDLGGISSTPQTSKPVGKGSECDAGFVNTDYAEFTWTSTDDGCAKASFFDIFIEIEKGDGVITKELTSDEESIKVEGLEDGDKVRVKVKGTDSAGNEGDWSEFSDWIVVDRINPELDILNTNDDEWITGDLEISENDSDNNLFKCFYQVKNDGIATMEWTEAECNSAINIDTGVSCPADGKDNCWVYKKVQDKACNENVKWKEFDVDNNGPILDKKVVEGPSYSEGMFATTKTKFEITATDKGTGVKELCYAINGGEPICVDAEDIVNELSNTFSFEEESEHNITFWATDNLEHKTEKSQVHYIDETAPITTKTYSIFIQKIGKWMNIENFIIDWIGPKTVITLKGEDPLPHPSGVKKTLFRMEKIDDGENSEWYGIDGKWYDSEEDCETANAPKPEPSPSPEESPSPSPSPELGIDNGEGNCVEVPGWSGNGWTDYENPIEIEGDSVQKICYKSIDNLDNEEKQMCQVFFTDSIKPEITPFKLPDNQCQKSVNAMISDEDSGVKRAWVEWINDNKTTMFSRDMNFYPETGVWDASFLASDLGALKEGSYIVRINAEDNVGNTNYYDLNDTLMKAVCVLSITPSQCYLDSSSGGSCVFNFNVIVRGGNAVQMGMDNLFGLSPQNLTATLFNSFGTKAVGNDMLWNGGILRVSNSSNKGSFKLSLDIPATITGSETLEYYLKPETV